LHDLTISQLLAVWLGMTLVILTGLAAAFAVAAVAWTVLDLLV
jgi:phage-related protein